MDKNASKKHIELLAPACNMSGFMGVINAGCDAVYLAGTKYGARAYADNFSDDEIIYAIKYAHLFNVRVYLTVNTLIKERELNDVIEYVRPFAEAGLDAFIVQDFGLMSALLTNYPNVSLHISTQAFSTSTKAVSFFKELGADRVVLARELSLSDIKAIKESVDCELETFIHGALCYSYSGQCLFSSALGGRSGNRGRCAGPCRQCYDTGFGNASFNNQYVLSMKDQCTLSIISQLIEAGIDSLKIEGRMKKPEYAAFVTSIYRKYIDMYYEKGSVELDSTDIKNISNIYLRSETSPGYYFQKKSDKLLTLNSPGYSGNDETLMEKIRNDFLIENKKLPVKGYVYCVEGEELILNLSTDTKFISVSGSTVEKSINKPLMAGDLKKQISKLGNTPFVLVEFDCTLSDNAFVPLGAINELRRIAVEDLLNEYKFMD